MRAAICLSGYTRTFKDTSQSLHDNFLKPLVGSNGHYDVFIYTSNTNDLSTQCLKNPDKSEIKPVPLSKKDISDIVDLYRPKMMVIEPLNDSSGFDRLPMLRRIWGANRLRKLYELQEGVNYDIVVRARMDTFFLKHVNYFRAENVIENQINVLKYGRVHDGIHDGLAIGTPKVMDKYSELMLYSLDYRKKMGDSHIKIEKVLMQYLLDREISINMIDIPTYILRSWGQNYMFHDQDPVTYTAKSQSI